MKIYNKSDQIIIDVAVDDNSYRSRVVMGDHSLTLYYTLAKHVEIPVGAYCEYEGERYTLMRPQQLKMRHTRLYEYTVTFSSEQDKAKIWKFRNPVDGRLKFPLTAKPKEHLQMFVHNMNRHDSGWTVGDCIDDVDKLVCYDHDYCWDALSKMASEFSTEFEISGKTVSLHKVEYNKSNPLPLSYGRGNGFKSGVGRSNSGDKMPTEILFVQGGDRNIDRSKYPDNEILRASSNGCLLLPVGQTIGYDGEHFEDEHGYNPAAARHYSADDLGLSIRNIDKELSSLAEDSLDRGDDYPKRVGTISKVDVVDKDKNFYDFIDCSIPADLNYEDYLIGDEQMTVVFQSGQLAGREFDVKYYHEPKVAGGKEKAGRRFEIVPQEIDGVMMPGTDFLPKAGDTYAVFNVMLPEAYIRNDADKSGASWDMFRAAVRHLFDNEEAKYTFTGELDGLWAKKDWTNIGAKIRPGGFISFTNEQFEREGVLVRITSIKDYVNNPHSPKIELSNETVSAGVSSTLNELKSTEVAIAENHRSAIQFTKRRYRDAKETIDMIETALSDNFTSRINPIAVETMSLLVGDERLQYQFVAQPGSTEAVPHNIEWNKATKQLHTPAGTIQHLTLGIDSIRPSHDPDEYLYWNVAEFESAALSDGAVRYFLYIRAPKRFNEAAGSAVFRLETEAHRLEEGAYYWLLVGVLNSEYDGDRSFATLYGFTEILPGRITADRLMASDGESYFDMLNAAMKLKDKLIFNENGDGQLKLCGTIVQSRNGVDEAPLGCYRGIFDASTTYFNGDEVVYQINTDSPLSTYRCISDAPVSGVMPTDTQSWRPAAAGVAGPAGADGKDGSSINIKGTAVAHFEKSSEWAASEYPTQHKNGVFLIDYDDGENDRGNCIIKKWGIPRPGAMPGWQTKTTEPGDAYIMESASAESDGDLYVSDGEKWINAGKIKGTPGNYTEYRFAANGSPTQAPAIDDEATAPAGWTTWMPDIGNGSYLWLTKAVKSGSGNALIGKWSRPVRISAQDGKDGASPALVFRGKYDSKAVYVGSEIRVDAVRYNNAYYVARTDAGQFSGIAPTDNSKWNDFGTSFESVATGLLLAENANIANLIFRNQRLESAAQTDGVPNFFIDGIQNVASFAAGKAVFDGSGARIGWLYIEDKDLVGIDLQGIERLRITPNALPAINTTGTTTNLVVKAYGGNSRYIGDTPSEVSFEYDAYWAGDKDYDGQTTYDNILTAYVEFDIAESSTRLDLSNLQGHCSLRNINGSSIANEQISEKLSASIMIKNGNGWQRVADLAISQGQYEASIPRAGRIRVWLYYSVHVYGLDTWDGTLQISAQGFLAKTAREEVFIAKDGIMAVYNANYLRFHSAKGFEIRVGNHGMKITTGGIQKTTNGGISWSSL